MSPRLSALPLLVVLAACPRPSHPEADEPCREMVQVRVLDFFDGDTADVELLEDTTAPDPDAEGAVLELPAGTVERIRLLAVDTAEVDHDDENNSECWALEAWNASQEALGGQTAWMTFDVECTGTFGRTLVYLFRDSDDLFLNHFLITSGHSPAFFPAYSAARTFETEFLAAEEEASSAGRGGWAVCNWQLGGEGT